MLKVYISKTVAALRVHGLGWTVRKVISKIYMRPQAESWDYAGWLERYGTVRDSDIAEMKQRLSGFRYRPLISIVIPVYNTDHSFLRQMLDSVLAQVYPYFEVCIADDASSDAGIKDILLEYARRDDRIRIVFRPENGGICAASNSALAEAAGEYVALVDHDDILPPDALYTICHYIDLYDNEVDILFSDEDKLDAHGIRVDPYFKGGWNRRLIFQQNFVAHLGVYRRSIVNEIGGFREGFEGSQDYDLLLRFLKRTTDARIVHVPHILYSWRKNPKNDSFSAQHQNRADQAAKRSLTEYFEGKKQILPQERLCGCWRITDINDKPKPLVSVIIPVKDKAGLLRNCIRGLLEKTDYPNIEILIVDNGSREEKTLRYLKELDGRENVRILRDDSAFNYSRLNNEAAAQARGEYLLFLNDDIAVIEKEKDWLANMVNVAMEESVGAVGAKLLYADNTVQHAGVVTGIYEVASHLYRNFRDSDEGYYGLLILERNVSAVTGACMLVPRRVFREAGGFDEQNLAVSFNDADLCLKIRDAGYDVVYTPGAKLYHLESQSRGEDVTKAQREQNYAERRFMLRKYGKVLLEDPYYSPVLSLTNEEGNLADRPRVGKPWRDQIEFVCPFHRGDVLVGLQVACTAAKHGLKVRMHVSRELVSWLNDFEYGDSVTIEPIDIDIPTAEQTDQFLREATDKVALREDSSCRILCSHPVRNLEDMGIDLAENMLRQFGLPIDTKLINVGVKRCAAEREAQLREMVVHPLEKTVLLHPYGGWQLKSMSPEIVKKTVKICHDAGYKVVQIGGAADAKTDGADGALLMDLPLSAWAFLFRSARAVIGVDSWTAHFASILDVDQAIVYGPTDHRDVGSKRHFLNSSGRCVVIPSHCELVPCNSLVCRRGSAFCVGMDIDDKLKEILEDQYK